MNNLKDFKHEWNELKTLGSGGQAQTIMGKHKESKNIVAIKKLLNQKSEERRGRMWREVAALTTLKHPRIPHFVGSNAEHWRDQDYKLFIAMEYIEGKTLNAADFTDYPLEEKIELIRILADTTVYYHSMGFLHRDLKPDNIIIRKGNIHDPVIIDFGISFNFDEKDDDFKTPDGHHLGNRFLILPEQRVGEAGKHDARSDVTYLTGLLFYILTGLVPIALIDENGHKPHQREDAKAILSRLDPHRLALINHFFDVGFSQAIDVRWQTALSLIEQLDNIMFVKEEKGVSADDLLSKIQAAEGRVAYQEAAFTKKIIEESQAKIRQIRTNIKNELGDDWALSFSVFGASTKYENEGYDGSYHLANRVTGTQITMFSKIYITGSELVIHSRVEGNKGGVYDLPAFRQPIKGEKEWAGMETLLREQYIIDIV